MTTYNNICEQESMRQSPWKLAMPLKVVELITPLSGDSGFDNREIVRHSKSQNDQLVISASIILSDFFHPNSPQCIFQESDDNQESAKGRQPRSDPVHVRIYSIFNLGSILFYLLEWSIWIASSGYAMSVSPIYSCSVLSCPVLHLTLMEHLEHRADCQYGYEAGG